MTEAEPSCGLMNVEQSASSRSESEFTFSSLAEATSFFSYACVIGEGAVGQVYKGKIDNRTVAIKKLKIRLAEQQQEEDFVREITALKAIEHENLVKLIGFCCDGVDRLLVSDYISNRSLYFHLHGNEKKTTTLDWSVRMKIALGSAKALDYLHQNCEPKIIHRDIKSDNILLDNDFTPKVSDFGLAKIFPSSESINHISYLMKGTPIYADPEKEKVSEKSDVYSFGVVLLEFISGRKPLVKRISIVEWAKPLILKVMRNEIDISQLIDPKLVAILSQEEMEKHKSEMEMMLYCAAASVYKPSDDRPNMSQIVQALEKEIDINEIWDMDNDSAFLKP